MSTEAEHAHAFARDMTGLCRCGMTAEQYRPQVALDNVFGDQAFKHKIIVLPPGTKTDDEPLKFEMPTKVTRSIIIDWHVQQVPGVFIPDHAGLTNAETGEPILTAIELHVHGKVGYYVVAELVTLADAHGEPILDGEINSRMSIDDDGNLATATTWWHVAEMRVGK